MTNSACAAEPQSSEKGKTNGQSRKISEPSVFWFPVYEGIFEHAPILEDAVWLFMWLIARTTRDSDGREKVLGGIPIPDDRPAAELGFPVKTVRRWRHMLQSSGYINLIRTPYGFRYTLLKSKKWQKPTPRELPKQAISESARNRLRDLPLREERVPATGRESARGGKYKEDNTETTQRRDSGRDSDHDVPLKASPLKTSRTKPSGRGERQIGHAQTGAQIAKVMVCVKGTISHELADLARSNYYRTSEVAQRRCGEEVDSYRLALAAIDYPFDLSSTVLGHEFCWNVRKVVQESRNEIPRPKKWELCERILDECDRSWDHAEEYSNVGPPYWPPDFHDHINGLYERKDWNG
jgi:hypothetical protein